MEALQWAPKHSRRGTTSRFAGTPSLHTAAHEAAHVVQQRGGVQLKGGVGETDDPYERHADAVADRVTKGDSAADLLEAFSGGTASTSIIQRSPNTNGPAAGEYNNVPATPQPNLGSEGRSFLADGALCEGPAVGSCVLNSAQRARLVQAYFNELGACRSAFLSGCSMAYTDVKVEPDAQLPWYIDLAINIGGSMLGDALSRGLGKIASWAEHARPEAYARLFDGAFVSERELAFYGAVAHVPFGALQPVIKAGTSKGTKGVESLLTSSSDKGAGEMLVKVSARQGNLMFDYFKDEAVAQVDDLRLFALMNAFADADTKDPTVYKDQIIGRLATLKNFAIGSHRDADMAGGRAWQRGAVKVNDGKDTRIGLVEHDNPTFIMTKGDRVLPRSGERRRWIQWIDDPTLQTAALELTQARGNGAVLEIDRDTAENMYEGFEW
jgi:hypothetical protein